MKNENKGKGDAAATAGKARSRKAIEGVATFALLLIAVGLVAPFTDLTNASYLRIFKWIYAPGALLFTIARIVGATDPADSMRVRRLRRLEFWAGIAFCMGAFFWFYNEYRFEDYLAFNSGTTACLRETIYFTLVGAIIQVMCSFSIARRTRKENEEKQKKDSSGSK